MALAKYDSSLAYDQIMQRGLPGRVVEVTDPDTGIPVEGLLAMDGQPIARLVSNSQGYVQPFMVEDGPPLIRVRIETVAYHLLDLSLLGEASLAAQQAAQAAIDAANLVGAPADTAIATAVNAAGSATRAALDARYAGKALATSAAAGLMPAADKATLAAATGANIGSALVRRYSDGTFTTQQISLVGTPTATTHAVRKDYVDGLDAVPKLGYKAKKAEDAASTYPTGYSTGLFAEADGWPHPSFSQVVTFSPPGYIGGTVQWAYPYTDSSLPPKWRSATNATGNPWGPWQEVANAADIAAAQANITTLQEQSATIDDLTCSQYVIGVAGSSNTISREVTGTVSVGVFVAPYRMTLTSASLMFEFFNRTASDTDYITLGLYRRRLSTGAYDKIVTKTTQATGGEPIVSRKLWSFDQTEWTNQVLEPGDVISLQLGGFTGSPGSLVLPVLFTGRYQPL